jgi:hypothetical protein
MSVIGAGSSAFGQVGLLGGIGAALGGMFRQVLLPLLILTTVDTTDLSNMYFLCP